MERRDKLGLLFALGATVLFSFKHVIAKSAYRWDVDPLTLLTMRLYFAAPLLLLTLAIREPKRLRTTRGRDLAQIVVLGILGVTVAMGASFASLYYIPASLSNVLTFTYPALTVLVMLALYRQIPSRAVVLSLLVTFTGMLFIVPPGRLDLSSNFGLGAALALLSALTFAIYNALADRLLRRVSPLQLSALGTTAAMLTLIFYNGPKWHSEPAVVAHGALLGVVCGYLPFLAYSYALQYAGAARTVVVNTLGPPMTLCWAMLFLGERMTPPQLLGMACIVTGVLAAKLNKPVTKPALVSPAAPAVAQ